MKKIAISLLLSFAFFLSSCSIPFKLPDDGLWYNEELDIMLEFKTKQNSSRSQLTNIIWNSREDVLQCNIDHGKGITFYIADENGNSKDILQGKFDYSNDKIIITVNKLAKPFNISGTLTDIEDKTFIFTRQTTLDVST